MLTAHPFLEAVAAAVEPMCTALLGGRAEALCAATSPQPVSQEIHSSKILGRADALAH
jgi:hypothetical protein